MTIKLKLFQYHYAFLVVSITEEKKLIIVIDLLVELIQIIIEDIHLYHSKIIQLILKCLTH